jgi:hypothetical protein
MSKTDEGTAGPSPVGYKNPPAATRFRQHNDYGRRPRKPKKPDLYAEIGAVLGDRVTVTIGGVKTRMTIRKALLIRLREEANKGHVWALKLIERVIESWSRIRR